jgi:hypothetical protein
MTPLQMACGISDHMGAAGDASFIQAFVCTFADAGEMSFTAFGLVVWFTVSAMTQTRQQSLIMPIVYLLVLGSVVLTMVPSIGLGVAAILILGGGAGLTVLALRRLDRA